ncbi:MAG: NifB/NifX family molybdenum-iron cluster-binding protein [Gammaproteobacteria bacterium]|nr:NifB/NifX family molybdenum-iron cluster-binding protein [Gammaproteobacteria bacterium]
MRVAITSQNFRTITGHAGKTRRFMVFESDPGNEPVEMERIDLPRELSFHEFDGVGEHPLDSCDVVITQSCGFGFTRKLASRGIHVLVTSEGNPYLAARAVMHGEPLPAPDMRASHNHGHDHAGQGCGCHHD